MLHIDVRPDFVWPETCIIQTSLDGSAWLTRYIVAARPDRASARHDAESLARAYAAGARVVGAEARVTSHGESLSV